MQNMSADNVNINVLVDSKREYTEKMLDIVAPHICADFVDMFQEAKDAIDKNVFTNKTPTEVYMMILKQVSRWSDDESTVAKYTQRLLVRCDWLMSLLRTIMVLNTMVLAAIRNSDDSERVNVELPDVEVFVYAMYKKCASKITPSLFCKLASSDEEVVEKAEDKMAAIIEKCIKAVIMDMVPMKHLINQYMVGWGSSHFTCDDQRSIVDSNSKYDECADTIVDENTKIETNDEDIVTSVLQQQQQHDSKFTEKNEDDEDNEEEDDDEDNEEEDDDDNNDERLQYEQQMQNRARQIDMKMRKLKLKEQILRKRNAKLTPIGKTGVGFHVDGEKRKTVKLSKDNTIPCEYLGNDNDHDTHTTDEED